MYFIASNIENHILNYSINISYSYLQYSKQVGMRGQRSLFPMATTYPAFFKTNLVDPSRIIKIVQGNHCGIRVFYYQLLKLIFQLDTDKDGSSVDYITLLSNAMNKMLSKSYSHPNFQYLKKQVQFIENFVQNLVKAGEVHFQPLLDRNHEIDKAFVDVFDQFVKAMGVQKGQIQQIFYCLSTEFNIKISQIDKCIRFQESDVFVFVQSENQLYIAFLNLQQQTVENSIDKGIYTHKHDINDDKHKKSIKANDTIINIFGDMLHSSKHEGDSKHSNSFLTNNLNSSLSPSKRDDQVLTSLKVNSKPTKQPALIQKIKQEYNFKMNTQQPKFVKNQSRVQEYSIKKESMEKDKDKQRNSSPQGDVLYRPFQRAPTLQTISQVTASKQSLIYSKNNNFNSKKDPFDLVEDEEKGTFYKLFTNTRILSILPQPQRTNVKVLKSRFIGIHGRDLKRQ